VEWPLEHGGPHGFGDLDWLSFGHRRSPSGRPSRTCIHTCKLVSGSIQDRSTCVSFTLALSLRLWGVARRRRTKPLMTRKLAFRPALEERGRRRPTAATTADDGLVPAQLAQRCCSALRRRRKIAVEAIAALRRANYGPPAFRRPLGPCGGLGRSQAVRQRILIPPSGGSNPPAPAAQFPGDRQGCGQQRGHRRAIGRRTAWRLRIPLCPQCARSCHSLAGPPRASD
jgi:hypothetical protein